jgi:hemoglobin
MNSNENANVTHADRTAVPSPAYSRERARVRALLPAPTQAGLRPSRYPWVLHASTLIATLAILAGCGQPEKQDQDFYTSGSTEADQRAEQRITRQQQLRGEGTDETDVKRSLYDRLGGERGIRQIVDDYIPRVLADPRVNWQRRGVKSGGFLGMGKESQEWDDSPAAVEQLKKHFVQFISLATGGPAYYDGKEMKAAHAGMKITNSEFDASVGDLKATLDALGVPITEQKELMAIIETTRPQVVEER